MTNTQQPTIPAEDGEIERVLKYLVDNVELIRHRVELRHLKPADGFNHNERLKAEALVALKAREQRIALEAKLSQADDDWWAITHATVPEVKILLRERMKELTAQLSQLTQYNQSERSVEDE